MVQRKGVEGSMVILIVSTTLTPLVEKLHKIKRTQCLMAPYSILGHVLTCRGILGAAVNYPQY